MDLIRAYTHCPLCGSAAFREEGVLRRCADCGHIDFNNPIVAVGVWVFDAEGRVLLIERAKDPGKGKLGPPGGFVDAGETLEAAAVREVWEEVGLVISHPTYLCSAPNAYTYRGLTRPVCDVFLRAEVEFFRVKVEPGEVSGFRVLPLAGVDAEDLAFDSMRQALAALRYARGSACM